jgi:hypothetical protein
MWRLHIGGISNIVHILVRRSQLLAHFQMWKRSLPCTAQSGYRFALSFAFMKNIAIRGHFDRLFDCLRGRGRIRTNGYFNWA